MSTGLAQEFARSQDPVFRALVQAALARVVPDLIGEAASGPLTQAQVDKRHAWALDAMRNPAYWVERASMLLAGENSIRAVEMTTPPALPAYPTDAVVFNRLQALVNDMAGVKAGE